MKIINIYFSLIFFLGTFSISSQNFFTEGNGIRNIISAKIEGKEVLYISELDQNVSCYSIDGNLLWDAKTEEKAVVFEIEAADVDGDGNDDLLVVSGDGNVYCWNSDGVLLWKFNPGIKVRLSEVAVVNNGNDVKIFTGGNNYKLYEVDSKGILVSETPIQGVVRKLESGYFTNSNEKVLFLLTLNHDKYFSDFFGFIDPVSKRVVKKGDISSIFQPLLEMSFMLHDLMVKDIDNDNRDEILFFGRAKSASCIILNGDLDVMSSFQADVEDRQRYAYVYGTCLLPFKDQITFQMGGYLYVTDLKGNLIAKSGKSYSGIIYNKLLFLPESKQLFGAGQIGGGNGIYSYDVTKDRWWEEKHEFIGRHKEVENNLNTLYQQTLGFELPKYQKASDKSYNLITETSETKEVKKLKNQDVNYIRQYVYSENTDRSELVKKIGKEALRIDKRKPYDLSREDILNKARDHEKNNQKFTIWAGHGSDPFMLQIETIEQILKVAPNTCYGFVYAEMSHTEDPRVIHFVKEYIPRIAKAIRENANKAKLYFRYKHMFWAADCERPLWRELFFSNKYNDILVPSAEDTNNRLQDLNFAGRVGMFASGYVNDYAMRLVDDNPTSWRPLSPGGQRSVSPYLRNGAIMAAYGSRYGILFDIEYLEEPGMNILFALMKSGVLPVVEKEDILSIGSWHLIKDINENYLKEVNEGHDLCVYKTSAEDAVVSVPSVGWCGATVPNHDYSKIAMGVDYRWLNFLPEMPNGMVPITNVDYKKELDKNGISYSVSDIKHGYVGDKKISGKDYGKVLKNTIEAEGDKLLLKVKEASWSLIKLDDKHARLVLADPGYINPQDRKVTIYLQGRNKLINAVDILTKENISIKNKTIKLTVPAGSMRFIDLEYRNILK